MPAPGLEMNGYGMLPTTSGKSCWISVSFLKTAWMVQPGKRVEISSPIFEAAPHKNAGHRFYCLFYI
jgi:hypothetical protein